MCLLSMGLALWWLLPITFQFFGHYQELLILAEIVFVFNQTFPSGYILKEPEHV